MIKTTVYIPCHNYGHYIEKAVDSVINQTFDDWELIIINDGSTDDSSTIINQYKSHPKIAIIDQENKGLNTTNNIALRLAKGKYIIRLDADDIFEENILLILSNVLDKNPEVGLVYPDYYHIDESGEIIEVVRRKKIGEEVELLDLPAHGACTMFRTGFLRELGGYTENFSCQDGYDIWIRMIQKWRPYNINIPLFYYRRHNENLTGNQTRILETRRKIKKHYIQNLKGVNVPEVIGVVPVLGKPPIKEMDPFIDLNGKPLIWYTIREIEKSENLKKAIVTSEDERVLDYVSQFNFITPIRRTSNLSKNTTKMVDVVKHSLVEIADKTHSKPDAVCLLYVNTPLRQAHHIDKAIHTMMVFDVDSVLSIVEEFAPCYQHMKFGLSPINGTVGGLRLERKSIFKENGAIYLTRLEILEKENRLIGDKVGHITMMPEESVKINCLFDFWMAEKIINEWGSK